MLLLVAPLMVHTFLLYKEATRQTVIDNLNELALLSRAESAFLYQLIRGDFSDIKTITLLGDFAKGDDKLLDEHVLSQVAVMENLSSLYIAEHVGQSWKIILAANPDRMGKEDLEASRFNKIMSLGNLVYLYQDLEVGKRELRLGMSISPSKVMIMGVPLESIASTLIRYPSYNLTPIIGFSEKDNGLYYGSLPGFSLQTCKLYAPEELIDISSQPYSNFILNEGYQSVGVKIPISGESFYLVVALSREQFLDASSQVAFLHLFQLTILFALLGGGGVFFLTTRIARPLRHFFECLDKVSSGNLNVRYENDSLGFELNVLGQKFNQMVLSLEAHIQEAKQQRLAKELLKQELGIGHDIQKTILRVRVPELSSITLAQAFTPAKEVSGDFYDVFMLDDHRILFSVADTSGKGISACLYSLGVRSTIHALAKSASSLESLLLQVNEHFIEDAESMGTFVTLFVAILDLNTSKVIYASCGHPPAYLITDSGIQELSTQGISLGIKRDVKFKTAELTLLENQKIFLYTDGVIEAHNNTHQLYGKERLEAFLKLQMTHSPSVLVHDLQRDIELFGEGAEIQDDITMLCIEKRKT